MIDTLRERGHRLRSSSSSSSSMAWSSAWDDKEGGRSPKGSSPSGLRRKSTLNTEREAVQPDSPKGMAGAIPSSSRAA